MKIALTEIEDQVVFHHRNKTLGWWSVEAVEGCKLSPYLLIQTLGPPVEGAIPADSHLARRPVTLNLGQHLLHRPAGDKLGNDKSNQHYPKQSGNHQENATYNVGGHGFSPVIHQVISREKGW